MILDKLENLGQYLAVNDKIKLCISFLQNLNISELSPRRYDLSGDDLYCVVTEYETVNPQLFEAHNQYVDLQCLLVGEERMDYANRKDCAVVSPYESERDAALLSNENFIPLKINAGYFAMFFPDDAHRPCVTADKVSKNKKAIFKIKI